MIKYVLSRLVIGLLAANSVGELLASAFGWWGVLPGFLVGLWIGNELFSEGWEEGA